MRGERKEKYSCALADVFSLFTVLKSGASYKRIEAASDSSSLGEKLLMKRYNIKGVTLHVRLQERSSKLIRQPADAN